MDSYVIVMLYSDIDLNILEIYHRESCYKFVS